MNIVETIRRTAERRKLFPSGTEVIAGVSGGVDSVALLRILHTLGIPCTVAHLNHQLREEESDADEAFVRGLASELALPVQVKSADVKAIAANQGISIEMAARQARHAFFAEFDGATVTLAHQADDQVETFILKLARGAGTEGLCGMPYVQQIGSLRIVRPMLDIPRAEIIAWLKAGRFAWREDASNADEAYLRNRVRHSVLPLLERELNPGIRDTIRRTMDIMREENAWMSGMIGDATPDHATGLPRAAQRRILRKWLFDQGAADVDYETVERILELMVKGSGSTVYELNEHQRVVIEYGRPRFEEHQPVAEKPAWRLHLEPGIGWKQDISEGVGRLPAEASFDADKVGDAPIEVRAVQAGDRIEPFGMEGTRKLQDILTDLKVPRARRARIPVVVCRGEIIWLPGYRIARNWAVRGEQGRSVHVRIEHDRGC